jgi:hypothetical protein
VMTVHSSLLVKSQFKTNFQNVPNPNQCAHGHVLSWTVAPFLLGPGAAANSLKGIKNVFVNCVHCKLELNTLGFWVPPRCETLAVFIAEGNLPIKPKNHPFPDICSLELVSFFSFGNSLLMIVQTF